MHRKTFIGAAVALVSTVVLTGTAWADRLDDIKKAGVLRVAAFDGNPPFGYIDATTKKQVGHDIDLATEFAKSLGVKLELVPTNPANRVPLLTSGKADVCLPASPSPTSAPRWWTSPRRTSWWASSSWPRKVR